MKTNFKKITAIIITLNEEKHIKAVIKSAQEGIL